MKHVMASGFWQPCLKMKQIMVEREIIGTRAKQRRICQRVTPAGDSVTIRTKVEYVTKHHFSAKLSSLINIVK